MDEATQQNAALVEQAVAVSSLQEQATHLARIVSVFEIAAGAARSAAATLAQFAGKATLAGVRHAAWHLR